MPTPLQPAALIAVIDTVFQSYKDFIQQSDHNDPKNFTARHMAGKVALQHLTLLLTLARTIQTAPDNDLELQTAITAAQAELDTL